MRSIEVLAEEPSAKVVLDNLLPKLLGERCIFNVYAHNGYHGLIQRLPQRLRGYRKAIVEGADIKVVVLVDEDRIQEGCVARKNVLEQHARDAGLRTKTSAGIAEFHVVNRLAIEELEAWFFGQGDAIIRAFPNVRQARLRRAGLRDPDAVEGGTAEKLLSELQRAGYYSGLDFLPKIEVAKRISQHMDWYSNRSRSFNVLREGFNAAVATL